MADTYASLDKQIAEIEANLRLIEERKSEFVEAQKIDLDLIKNERKLQAQLAELRARRDRLARIPCPYRGLEYFDIQHAANYFGRAAHGAKAAGEAGRDQLRRRGRAIGLRQVVAGARRAAACAEPGRVAGQRDLGRSKSSGPATIRCAAWHWPWSTA